MVSLKGSTFNINGFGIELKKITEDDLELVRFWRNSIDVKSFMIYQKEITSEDQKKWFLTIDNSFNYYFIIYNHTHEKVGMINIKDIDYEKGKGEAGIFMFGNDKWGTGTSIKAGLIVGNYAFEVLGLKKLTCKVAAENSRALSFNQSFGYSFSRNGSENILEGILNKTEFYKFYSRFSRLFNKTK